MDNAVGLVRTCLQLNGYFTVTEYPIIAAGRHGGHRTMDLIETDNDHRHYVGQGTDAVLSALSSNGRAVSKESIQ